MSEMVTELNLDILVLVVELLNVVLVSILMLSETSLPPLPVQRVED